METMAELIQSSDSIILREVLRIISDAHCKGFRGFLRVMVSGLGKIGAMFVIQYYLKHTDKLPSILFSFFKAFFYKRRRLDMSVRKLPLYIARRFEAIVRKDFIYNCFPLEFYNDNECGVIEYLPFVHNSLVREVESRAQKDFDDSQSNEFTTLCHELTGDDIKPKKLFPSKNYCYLDDVVSSYFKVAEMTEIFSTKGILIDGEPGLGKTGSVEYLASLNKYGRVIKIDMTNQLDVLFKDIVKKVKKNNKETLIVLFDELDKYISHVVRLTYDAKRSSHNPKKGGILPTWGEHVTNMKEEFLFELLGLLENSYFDKGAIFIFCSNNFDTIFNGVDPTHFNSFKKRFLPIKFNRCGCEELKDYIRYYNDKLADSEWFREEKILDGELGRLRDDISIPYRDVNDLNISACYRVEKFVDNVNEWQQQEEEKSELSLSDLFSSPSSDDIKISSPKKEDTGEYDDLTNDEDNEEYYSYDEDYDADD